MRGLLGLALCWVGTAAAEPPTLPPALVGFVVNGEVAPGDLAWLRGRFADATEADKARLAEVRGWLEDCRTRATAEARARVEVLGERADALASGPYGDPACAAIERWVEEPLPAGLTSGEFHAAQGRAKPVLDAFLAGLEAGIGKTADAYVVQFPSVVLRARDQALREVRFSEAPFGYVGADAAVLRLLLGLELGRLDRRNTAELKALVSRSGWPRLPLQAEGDATAALLSGPSHAAWILTQHADHEPAWQVEALRLMRVRLAAGEATAWEVGFLEDRVALALVGEQIYGSQVHEQNGCVEPQPLHDPATVDERRRAIGLQPLSNYVASVASRSDKPVCK